MTAPVKTLLKRVDPRAGPAIITVFGDAIAPRGGSIWLGSLINLMQPLGLSERLVRTGVFRLAAEGWLEALQEGRRAYYSITRSGLKSFADADARIYAAQPLAWDGKWTLVQSLPGIPATTRKQLRNLLTWHGFGQLSPTMMIKPGANTDIVNQALKSAKLSAAHVTFTAEVDQIASQPQIVKQGWKLDELSDAYQHLLSNFSSASTLGITNARDAFIVRSLLIHQYRRILLKDPQLPLQLLPKGWHGDEARKLVADAYKSLSASADEFITEKMQDKNNKCPFPIDSYFRRFSIN